MFWNRLTQTEEDEYYRLFKLVQAWAGWCSISKKKRSDVQRPYEPTDDEFVRCEQLAMKGWNLAI